MIDTATSAVTARIQLTANAQSSPTSIAMSPDGSRAYVAVAVGPSAAVTVIDTAVNKVLAYIDCERPAASLALSPDGKRLYVPDCKSSSLSVIDTQSNAAVATIAVPGGLVSDMALATDGTYVFLRQGGSLTVVDPVSQAIVKSIPLDATIFAPNHVAVAPDGRFAYVTSQRCYLPEPPMHHGLCFNDIVALDSDTLAPVAEFDQLSFWGVTNLALGDCPGPKPTPTAGEAPTATFRATDTRTAAPTLTSTAMPTLSPTRTASPTPSATPTSVPTASPTPTKTRTVGASATPTQLPTATPSVTFALTPTAPSSQGSNGGCSIGSEPTLLNLLLLGLLPACLVTLRRRTVAVAARDADGDDRGIA